MVIAALAGEEKFNSVDQYAFLIKSVDNAVAQFTIISHQTATMVGSFPLLILTSNMPKLDGFQLRQKLDTDAELQLKCIPYLFFSTTMNQKMVIDAYSMSAQGFFVKQNFFQELEKTIRGILVIRDRIRLNLSSAL